MVQKILTKMLDFDRLFFGSGLLLENNINGGKKKSWVLRIRSLRVCLVGENVGFWYRSIFRYYLTNNVQS